MINNSQEQQKDSLLPPPEILLKYQELGINKNLIELVKAEQEHRHLLQNKYQINYRMGQLFGFILCLTFIIGIFKSMNNGYITESYILTGIFCLLVLLISIIVRSNKKTTTRRTSSTTIRSRTPQRRNSTRNYR